MRNFITEIKNKTVNRLNVTTMKTKIHIMAVCLLSLLIIVSCTSDDIVIRSSEQQKISSPNVASRTATTTYYVTPSVGNFTSPSSSSVILPGRLVYNEQCDSALGGVIQAKVKSLVGNYLTVEVSKQDGSPFSTSGTVYLSAGSICGNSYSSTGYVGGSLTKIDVSIYVYGFTTGVQHYYPVLQVSTGARYYAEPVMVYSNPSFISHTSETYYDGKVIGSVNGVKIYASGPTNIASQSGGSDYQCVEFVKRYYGKPIYNVTFPSWGTAYNGYYVSQPDLESFDNNNTKANGEPRPGDLIFFSGKTAAYSAGHVGIITEVSHNEVKIAHQNGGTNYPIIGWTLSRPSSKSINGTTIYNVLGWKRKTL